MFVFAVIASLIGCAVSQDICCSPDQWECTAYVGALYIPDASGLDFFSGESKVAYDWTNKKVAFDTVLEVNGTLTTLKIIRTFTENAGTQYLIEGDTCFTEEIPRGMTRSCVPGDAVQGDTYNLGVGTNTLSVTARFWQDLTVPYSSTGLSTTEGCVPVIQGIGATVDADGSQIELATTLIYGDVTPGIQNDAVFTPPSSCTPAKYLPKYITSSVGYRYMTQTF